MRSLARQTCRRASSTAKNGFPPDTRSIAANVDRGTLRPTERIA